MPNPFIRLGTPNVSDADMARDEERPGPSLTPVPEVYDGTNHPYRGTELHGVADSGKPYEVPGWEGGTRPVEYDPPEKASDPIPVRIVSEGSEELRTFRVRQSILQPNSVPTQVVGANPNRTSVRLKNNAAFFVYLGTDQSMASFTSWPVGSFETFELDTQGAIWMMNPDAVNAATIIILEQYSVSV